MIIKALLLINTGAWWPLRYVFYQRSKRSESQLSTHANIPFNKYEKRKHKHCNKGNAEYCKTNKRALGKISLIVFVTLHTKKASNYATKNRPKTGARLHRRFYLSFGEAGKSRPLSSLCKSSSKSKKWNWKDDDFPAIHESQLTSSTPSRWRAHWFCTWLAGSLGLNSVTGWYSHTDERVSGVDVAAILNSATAPLTAKKGRIFILNTPSCV